MNITSDALRHCW